LVWIWEHELHIGRLRKILDFHIHSALEPEVSFELSGLNFMEITHQQAFSFLASYHYLGNLGTAASPYGAWYNGELVCVIVFGGLTRKESAQKTAGQAKKPFRSGEIREIRRFCVRPNVLVKNLGSYCISKFISLFKQNNPKIKCIISFSDPTVGDSGGLYKACNFISLGKSSKSYHYLDPATSKLIHKKTVYELALAAHMKEAKFVASSKLVKIKEEPKIKWMLLI
jgi:hypothetical protein